MPQALTIALPGSKSITQRALMLAALAEGKSQISGALDCDDSRHLKKALCTLGAPITNEADRWEVRGGRLASTEEPLWCGDAGTTSRFLAPLALLISPVSLDGSTRLRQRPIAQLVHALEQLGVHADSKGLPLTLSRVAESGRFASVDASESSQFLSGLLLVGPLLPAGLELEVLPSPAEAVSWPYVEMTIEMMQDFGVHCEVTERGVTVPAGRYAACPYEVEGDWSAAAFWLVAERITGRTVELPSLRRPSLQGDSQVVPLLDSLGAGGGTLDLTTCPDLLPPLAVACALADHPSRITGVAHARTKECDRVAALARGLDELGFAVCEHEDGLSFRPGHKTQTSPGPLATYDDHRMAMAFGLLSLLEKGITVDNPSCVSKSYPDFWQELERWR